MTVIKEKLRSSASGHSTVSLSTLTGRQMNLKTVLSVESQPSTPLSLNQITSIQTDLNLSFNQTLTLASRIRSSNQKKRSPIEPNLKKKIDRKEPQV